MNFTRAPFFSSFKNNSIEKLKKMNALLLVAAFLAVVFASCIAVEGYPVEASIIAQNSTIVNGTEPFVWDFWRINKPPIIGGLIVLVVGVI